MNYIIDSDITMTPQFSVSKSEKRGEFSRFITSGETTELYTWFKVFTKALNSGRYKFTATISEQNPSKNNILGFSTQPDLYGSSVTFETNDNQPTTIYLGLKKNSSCLISNILLEKIGEALPPRPPFMKPPIENIRETYTNQDDGREKVIIWTKGLKNPPKMGGDKPDFRRTVTETDITYDVPYMLNQGWYDANKDDSDVIDDSLCFIAASTNSLYWWLDINKEYITRYFNEGGVVPKDPNKHRQNTLLAILNGNRPQHGSNLWQYFMARYGHRASGGFTDVVQDQFLNGYWFDNPESNGLWPLNSEDNQGQRVIEEGVDPNGGFFYNVLGIRKLTDRIVFDGQNLPEYTRVIRETLENGGIVCPSLYYALYGNSGHIITMWGAEFNTDDNSLSAIYVSDSDDAQKDETFGMERRVISTKDNGVIKMTTRADGTGGAKVYKLNTLMAGTEFWEAYFNKGGDIKMENSYTFKEAELKHLTELIVGAIPENTSELNNDSDFATNASVDEKIASIPETKGPKGDKGESGKDATINGHNAITIVQGDGIKISNIGTEFTITSNKEVSKLVTVSPSGNILTLTKDVYQTATIPTGTTIKLPTVNSLTIIHLFFKTTDKPTFTFPNIKWQNKKTPEIDANKTYEMIFTYTTEWLGGVIVYE